MARALLPLQTPNLFREESPPTISLIDEQSLRNRCCHAQTQPYSGCRVHRSLVANDPPRDEFLHPSESHARFQPLRFLDLSLGLELGDAADSRENSMMFRPKEHCD